MIPDDLTDRLRELATVAFGIICAVCIVVCTLWLFYLTAPANAMSLGGR